MGPGSPVPAFLSEVGARRETTELALPGVA